WVPCAWAPGFRVVGDRSQVSRRGQLGCRVRLQFPCRRLRRLCRTLCLGLTAAVTAASTPPSSLPAGTIGVGGPGALTAGVSVALAEGVVMQLYPAPLALGTRLAEGFQQPGSDAFAGHLDQPERGDLGDLVPSTVSS